MCLANDYFQNITASQITGVSGADADLDSNRVLIVSDKAIYSGMTWAVFPIPRAAPTTARPTRQYNLLFDGSGGYVFSELGAVTWSSNRP